jgi:hypothetical protein
LSVLQYGIAHIVTAPFAKEDSSASESKITHFCHFYDDTFHPATSAKVGKHAFSKKANKIISMEQMSGL